MQLVPVKKKGVQVNVTLVSFQVMAVFIFDKIKYFCCFSGICIRMDQHSSMYDPDPHSLRRMLDVGNLILNYESTKKLPIFTREGGMPLAIFFSLVI
jgi:hypothetical protein